MSATETQKEVFLRPDDSVQFLYSHEDVGILRENDDLILQFDPKEEVLFKEFFNTPQVSVSFEDTRYSLDDLDEMLNLGLQVKDPSGNAHMYLIMPGSKISAQFGHHYKLLDQDISKIELARDENNLVVKTTDGEAILTLNHAYEQLDSVLASPQLSIDEHQVNFDTLSVYASNESHVIDVPSTLRVDVNEGLELPLRLNASDDEPIVIEARALHQDESGEWIEIEEESGEYVLNATPPEKAHGLYPLQITAKNAETDQVIDTKNVLLKIKSLGDEVTDPSLFHEDLVDEFGPQTGIATVLHEQTRFNILGATAINAVAASNTQLATLQNQAAQISSGLVNKDGTLMKPAIFPELGEVGVKVSRSGDVQFQLVYKESSDNAFGLVSDNEVKAITADDLVANIEAIEAQNVEAAFIAPVVANLDNENLARFEGSAQQQLILARGENESTAEVVDDSSSKVSLNQDQQVTVNGTLSFLNEEDTTSEETPPVTSDEETAPETVPESDQEPTEAPAGTDEEETSEDVPESVPEEDEDTSEETPDVPGGDTETPEEGEGESDAESPGEARDDRGQTIDIDVDVDPDAEDKPAADVDIEKDTSQDSTPTADPDVTVDDEPVRAPEEEADAQSPGEARGDQSQTDNEPVGAPEGEADAQSPGESRGVAASQEPGSSASEQSGDGSGFNINIAVDVNTGESPAADVTITRSDSGDDSGPTADVTITHHQERGADEAQSQFQDTGSSQFTNSGNGQVNHDSSVFQSMDSGQGNSFAAGNNEEQMLTASIEGGDGPQSEITLDTNTLHLKSKDHTPGVDSDTSGAGLT